MASTEESEKTMRRSYVASSSLFVLFLCALCIVLNVSNAINRISAIDSFVSVKLATERTDNEQPNLELHASKSRMQHYGMPSTWANVYFTLYARCSATANHL